MTFAALALSVLVVAPAGQQDDKLPAPKLVSKMLKHYSDASTMTGTIVYTARAEGIGEVSAQTTLQFAKPDKLYIKQSKGGAQPQTWLVTCDGKNFSYNMPGHLQYMDDNTSKRLTEPMQQRDGLYDFRRVYAVAAAGSLGDRSAPLDIAIGRTEDLQHLSLTWATVKDAGEEQGGRLISGDWRPYGDAQVQGKYEMLVGADGKLLRYAIQRSIAAGQRPVVLTETWTVNLAVNGTPDPALWRVIR